MGRRSSQLQDSFQWMFTKGSWSSLASSRGSSKSSGFVGSAWSGVLSVGESLARRAKQFWFSIGIQGTRRLSEGSVVLAPSETSFGDSGKGTRRRLLAGSTVKDQSSHSIKANHRGPGSRLKVKAIKSKLIQDCQSELQEPQLTFKRPTRAMVNVQEAHKSCGQHSRGPQVTRGARMQEASRRSA
ncbi:hypothetical protein B0F90DRAFT_1153045 [Multifurca ochricompacta]|uniref:Uncharacterized protein n=1 Tax=Multifurca ochricompacta TaxID=376703 RepID=A0AAD4QKZ5_9AGAM|nr:hypothetical protein B0F90DRAFT_1153045 [Multifurca ochricompacta]